MGVFPIFSFNLVSIASGWQVFLLGDGGYVCGVNVSDAGMDGGAVCRTDVAGGYYWEPTDGTYGKWRQVNSYEGLSTAGITNTGTSSNGIWELTGAPSDYNYLYMVFSDMPPYPNYFRYCVFYSTDKGLHWYKTNVTFTVNGLFFQSPNSDIAANLQSKFAQQKIVVDPANPLVCYVGLPWTSTLTGTYEGLTGCLRTLDGGANWESVPSIPTPERNPGCAGMVFDRSDGTTTLAAHGAFPSVTVTKRIIVPSSGNGVYESNDGGATFTQVASDPTPDTVVSCTTANANSVIIVQVGCYAYNTVRSISDDHGLTWLMRNGPGNSGTLSNLYEFAAVAASAATYVITIEYADGSKNYTYYSTLLGTATGCTIDNGTPGTPGTTLTIGSVTFGSIAVGQGIRGGTGVPAGDNAFPGAGNGVYIVSQTDATHFELNTPFSSASFTLNTYSRPANQVCAFAVSGVNTTNPFDVGNYDFDASISGTTMTMTTKRSGAIVPGLLVIDSNNPFTGVASGTRIIEQLTGNAGDVGDYRVSISQTVSGRAMNCGGEIDPRTGSNRIEFGHTMPSITTHGTGLIFSSIAAGNDGRDANYTELANGSYFNSEITSSAQAAGGYRPYGTTTFTGYIDNGAGSAGTTLTVTAITSGPGIMPQRYMEGSGVTTLTYIVSQLTGTEGSTGTYQVSISQLVGSAGTPTAGLTCRVVCMQIITDALIQSGTIALDATSVVSAYSDPAPTTQPASIVMGQMDASGTYWCVDGMFSWGFGGIFRYKKGSATWDRIDGSTASARSNVLAYNFILGPGAQNLCVDPRVGSEGRVKYCGNAKGLCGSETTNGNAAVASITWAGESSNSSGGRQSTITSPVVPWQNFGTFTNFDGSAFGDEVQDPITGKFIQANGKGIWLMDSDFSYNPGAYRAVGTSIPQGQEEMLVGDIVSAPGWTQPCAGVEDEMVFKANLPAYPSWVISSGDAHAWNIDWASDNPNFAVAYITNSTTPQRSTSFSTNQGNAGTWHAVNAQAPPTTPVGGGCIACASTGADGANSPNTTACYLVVPNIGSTTPIYTVNNGTNWTSCAFSGTAMPKTFIGIKEQPTHVVAADRVNIGTYYIHVPSTGVFKSTDYGANFSAMANSFSDSTTAPNLLSVHGFAGHLFFKGTFSANNIRYTTDAGATAWGSISGFDTTYMMCLGKEAPGGSYPTLFVYGVIGGVGGFYRGDPVGASPASGYTWTLFGKANAAYFGDIAVIGGATQIWGDWNTYGRMYVGWGASGALMYNL